MKVVFVCYGNICRSPMAEVLFRKAIEDRPALRDVEVESAGVGAWEGNCASEHAVTVIGHEYGLDLAPHRAQMFTTRSDADLVLALDTMTLQMAQELEPPGRVELLGAYAGTNESVGDPYGGSIAGFRRCARDIQRLVEKAADRLERELTGDSAD